MSINSITTEKPSTIAGSSLVVLVGRALLSAMFIFAGYSKLAGIAGTAAWFGSIGLPMPTTQLSVKERAASAINCTDCRKL